MKFTKSFQAKAIASEKVPARTTSLYTFTFNSNKNSNIINQIMLVIAIKLRRFVFIHAIISLYPENADHFKPFAITKWVIAVNATAHNIALQNFGFF